MAEAAYISAKRLTKQFGKLVAVNEISFQIHRGECLVFLGPNGAGKTTTMKMLYCAIPPTSGDLTIAKHNILTDCREIKSMIGVAPQEDNLDPDFTVRKNLLVYARYFNLPRTDAEKQADTLLQFVNLTEKQDVVIEQLSSGMKRRLILARALINDPRILILDEPTTGLDPQGRHLLWEKIRSLQKQGVTIILTTHYMEEAEQLCDRILLLDHGQIIEQGTPTELIAQHIGEEVLEVRNGEGVLDLLKDHFPDARFEVIGGIIQVFCDHPRGNFADLIEHFAIKEARIRDANLEDVFLKLTGRGLRE